MIPWIIGYVILASFGLVLFLTAMRVNTLSEQIGGLRDLTDVQAQEIHRLRSRLATLEAQTITRKIKEKRSGREHSQTRKGH